MAKRVRKEKIGELLEREGLISPEQIEEALELQRESGCLFGEALVELEFATEEDIAISLVNQLGCPFMKCTQYDYDSMVDLIDLFPTEMLQDNAFFPIDQVGNTIMVVSAGPLSPEVEKKIINLTGCDVALFISTPSDIREAVDAYLFKKEQEREKQARAMQ